MDDNVKVVLGLYEEIVGDPAYISS